MTYNPVPARHSRIGRHLLTWLVGVAVVLVLILVVQSVSLATSKRQELTSTDCAQAWPGAARDIDQFNQSQKYKWDAGGATYGPGYYLPQLTLYKIIYSPGLDTCVKIVLDHVYLREQKQGPTIVFEESYDFFNVLTGKYIDWIDIIQHGAPYYSMDDLAQKISNYETATSSPITLGAP